jgi:cyclopropane-fatty-acyl-phospholipid synthase
MTMMRAEPRHDVTINGSDTAPSATTHARGAGRPVTITAFDGSAVQRARLVLDELFGPVAHRTFAVRLWDGTIDAPRDTSALPFTFVVTNPGALRRALLPPSEFRLAMSFIRGDLDIEGDLERASELADTIRARLSSPSAIAALIAHLLTLPGERAHSGAPRSANGVVQHRDAAAIRFHYDVGNDFYALWLDHDMVYSCAYFKRGDETIDEAQRAKLDLICRKLRLLPGERLLDIGCGWGALIRHAVKHYGVTALGVTLSPSQAEIANQRIHDAGLSRSCVVELRDYRDLGGMKFDKIASVGMFEHVGRKRLPTYFRSVFALLEPGGLFLNHGIIEAPEVESAPSSLASRVLWRKGDFIGRLVFPRGELVRLDEEIAHGEGSGFKTRDVESLREHYVLTLRKWRQRLEMNEAEATRLVGRETYRTWRLYLAASTQGFESGRLNLAQVLFAKPDGEGRVRVPRTREDIYRGTPRPLALASC